MLPLEPLAQYMAKFQWDVARFPVRQSVRALAEMIAKVSILQQK